MPSLHFDRSFTVQYERAEWLSPRLRRLTANNPGPFTFTGTNTYIIGTGKVAVVDPGPDDEAHFNALLTALRGETVTHIFVTHTHKDHSPLARRLHEATGAPIYAEGPHRAFRNWKENSQPPLDASNDMKFMPHHFLRDSERIAGEDWILEAVATPGHTANHMAYALLGEEALFSGDHIMAWSTCVIAPPDGEMQAYINSLQKIATRQWHIIWPGHGGPIQQAEQVISSHLMHRRQRELEILSVLKEEPVRLPDIVRRIYKHLPDNMHEAAALSAFAHLEDLCARGLVTASPKLTLNALYTSNQRSFSF